MAARARSRPRTAQTLEDAYRALIAAAPPAHRPAAEVALNQHEALLCDFAAIKAARNEADRILKAYDVQLRRELLQTTLDVNPQVADHPDVNPLLQGLPGEPHGNYHIKDVVLFEENSILPFPESLESSEW